MVGLSGFQLRYLPSQPFQESNHSSHSSHPYPIPEKIEWANFSWPRTFTIPLLRLRTRLCWRKRSNDLVHPRVIDLLVRCNKIVDGGLFATPFRRGLYISTMQDNQPNNRVDACLRAFYQGRQLYDDFFLVFLADVTQQIHSLRASGVISVQTSFTMGSRFDCFAKIDWYSM